MVLNVNNNTIKRNCRKQYQISTGSELQCDQSVKTMIGEWLLVRIICLLLHDRKASMVRQSSQLLVRVVIVKDIFGVEYGALQSGGASDCWPVLHQRRSFLNECSCRQPRRLMSDARVNRIPSLPQWSPARNQQGGKKRMGGCGKCGLFSCFRTRQLGCVKEAKQQTVLGQLERFTRVGDLGELAQLQQLLARASARARIERIAVVRIEVVKKKQSKQWQNSFIQH